MASKIATIKVNFSFKEIGQDVENAVIETLKAGGSVRKELINNSKKRVANWKNKPAFKGRVKTTIDAIILTVAPVQPKEAVKIYTFVSLGTKPHKIRPKNAGSLAFRAGPYTPKTTPSGGFGGSGKSAGPFVLTGEIEHPGTEARNLPEHILADSESTIDKELNDAVKDATS